MQELPQGESLGRIYAAASDTAWPGPFLDVLQEIFRADFAVVAYQHRAEAPLRMKVTDPNGPVEDVRSLFRDGWRSLSGTDLALSRILHSSTRPEEGGAEGAEGHWLGTDGQGSLVYIFVQSAKSDRAAEVEWTVLGPHAVRAAAVRFRLEELERRHSVVDRTLNSLSPATFIVGPRGDLLHANLAGRRILDEGKYLSLRGGKVAPANSRAAREFLSLLRRSFNSESIGAMTLPAGADNGEKVLLAARGLNQMDDEPLVLLYLARPFNDLAALEPILRQAFGLTRMESRTAATAMKGDRLVDVARELGVGVETTRAHIRGALAKTGARRQIQLLSRVAEAGVFSSFEGDGLEPSGIG